MATIKPIEPPKIVCTKCVRIVRIIYWEVADNYDGSAYVATECCERVFGVLDGPMRMRDPNPKRDRTVAEIIRNVITDEWVEELAERYETIGKRLEAIKWASK